MSRQDINSVKQNISLWSSIIRFLRIVGPIAIISIILYIFLWSYLKSTFYFQLLENKFKHSNLLVNLKLVTADEHGNPMRISARSAKDVGQGKAILDAPYSEFTTEDGTSMRLSANFGNLDKARNSLVLQGSVDLKTKTGYELKAPSAFIDLKEHSAESFEPVYGKGLRGEIQSQEGIKITSDGDIFFKGYTTLTINSKDNEQKPSEKRE